MIKRLKIESLLILTTIIIFILSICIGRFQINSDMILKSIYQYITGKNMNIPYDTYTVITQLRLPRAVLAIMVGGALAASGAAFQGLFRNPLVCSSILGISSGAGFGAALSIVLFSGTVFTSVFSFSFGIIAVSMSYFIGRIYKSSPTITLILGGTIVSSMFSALLQLIKYIADPYQHLPSITFWMMGSLGQASSKEILISSFPMIIGMIGLSLLGWRINVLSMGDKEARTLGLNVTLNKVLVISFATLTTAAAVSVSGVIGWVGLIIPHIGRMLVGTNNKRLIPISILLGNSFMLIVDTICRSLTSAEIPLGVVTALIGGPFFIYLLKKTKGENW